MAEALIPFDFTSIFILGSLWHSGIRKRQSVVENLDITSIHLHTERSLKTRFNENKIGDEWQMDSP